MPLLNFHTYGKIKTLFKRNEQGQLIDEWSHPVVGSIACWNVYEKIDGMNIRIGYQAACNETEGKTLRYIGGRTDNSEIPSDLFTYLDTTFTLERLQEFFGDENGIIYGEGVGPKIQGGKAKGYDREELIAFDIVQGGQWRCDRESELQRLFDVKWAPYFGEYGVMVRDLNINKDNFESWENYTLMRNIPTHMNNIKQWNRYRTTCVPEYIEGFIFRPHDRTKRAHLSPLYDLTLFDEHGDRVIFKLKRKDVFSDDIMPSKK